MPDPSTGGPRIWKRQDGTAAASFEVTASTVRFLGRGEGETAAPLTEEAITGDEDIPF